MISSAADSSFCMLEFVCSSLLSESVWALWLDSVSWNLWCSFSITIFLSCLFCWQQNFSHCPFLLQMLQGYFMRGIWWVHSSTISTWMLENIYIAWFCTCKLLCCIWLLPVRVASNFLPSVRVENVSSLSPFPAALFRKIEWEWRQSITQWSIVQALFLQIYCFAIVQALVINCLIVLLSTFHQFKAKYFEIDVCLDLCFKKLSQLIWSSLVTIW